MENDKIRLQRYGIFIKNEKLGIRNCYFCSKNRSERQIIPHSSFLFPNSSVPLHPFWQEEQ
jgi:hypothetical protein